MHEPVRRRRRQIENCNDKPLRPATTGTSVSASNHATQVTGGIRTGHDETDTQVREEDAKEQAKEIHEIPCVPTAEVHTEETAVLQGCFGH